MHGPTGIFWANLTPSLLASAARLGRDAHVQRGRQGGPPAPRVPARPRQHQPRATLPFYTVVDCHWLAFLRDLHTNLAAVAAMFSQNDRLARG